MLKSTRFQIAVLACLLCAGFVLASMPVQVTIVGCVQKGVLITESTDYGTHKSAGRYEIRPQDAQNKAINLAPYEGKRISIKGNLLPGDTFIADKNTLKVLGACPKK